MELAEKDQVLTTEDVENDSVAEAVSIVEREVAAEESGEVKKEAVTDPAENSQQEEESPKKDETTEGEGNKEDEEAPLEDLMSKGEKEDPEDKHKTDIEKAKEGTPDWLQKRLDKQTKQHKEAIEAKDERIAQLEEKVRPEKRPPVPVEGDFPDRESFNEAYQKWKDDDDNWKASEKTKVARAEADEKRLNAQIKRYQESSARMSEKYEDFDKIVNKETFYGDLDKTLLATDFAGEISYHLGKNPKKLERLLNMDPISAAIEIGEMSAKCKSSGTKTLSTAPKVLDTVKDTPGGGGDDGSGISLSEIDKISQDHLQTA